LQFRCSLLGRRFPALRSLKHDQVVKLILVQRKATGQKLEVPSKIWPKTKTPTVAELHFATDEAPGKWERSLHGPHGHLATRQRPREAGAQEEGAAAFAQRHNPVWQWAGHVRPGRKRWLCSGAAGARRDVERPNVQARK
jgi:hypothetical protein